MWYNTEIALIVLTAQWTKGEQITNQVDFVKQLRMEGYIRSNVVEHTMSQVDLKYFIPGGPYDYNPRTFVAGHYACPTHLNVYALETLKDHLKPGNKALDVAFGSAYLTVCMALMVGKEGYAVGVEEELHEAEYARSRVRLSHPDLLTDYRIKFYAGQDLYEGAHYEAPFDAIHVGTIKTLPLPIQLIGQLNLGGKMMIPIISNRGIRTYIIDKLMNGTIVKRIEQGEITC